MYHMLSRTTLIVLNIKEIVFSFFREHQISVLDWFLKDRVIRKTGIMAVKYSALPS